MNILFTSYDPSECATFIEPNLVPKALDEVSKILNDALLTHLGNKPVEDIYLDSSSHLQKPTLLTHPCVLWAAKNHENFDWLLRHFCQLQQVHIDTFMFQHPSLSSLASFSKFDGVIPHGEFTTPPNLAVDYLLEVDFTDMKDVAQAYRLLIHARSGRSVSREPKNIEENFNV